MGYAYLAWAHNIQNVEDIAQFLDKPQAHYTGSGSTLTMTNCKQAQGFLRELLNAAGLAGPASIELGWKGPLAEARNALQELPDALGSTASQRL